MAFLYYRTRIAPQLAMAEDGLVYAVFPQNEIIDEAIAEFKKTDTLIEMHRFLKSFKIIKKGIRRIKDGEL